VSGTDDGGQTQTTKAVRERPAPEWLAGATLIPGGILLTIGAAVALGRSEATQLVWPVALILLSVALLMQRGRGRRS